MIQPPDQVVASPTGFPSVLAPHMSRRYRALGWCGIAGPALITACTSVSAIRAQNHSLISDTVSDLAAKGMPDTLLLRTGMIAFGLLIILFAIALAAATPVHSQLLEVSLVVFGLSIAMTGIFQDYSEQPGIPHNREGFLHNSFGILAIVALLGSMVAMAHVVRLESGWRNLKTVNTAATVIVLFAGVGFLRGPVRLQGIDELVLYGAALIWLVSIARLVLEFEHGRPPVDATIRKVAGADTVKRL